MNVAIKNAWTKFLMKKFQLKIKLKRKIKPKTFELAFENVSFAYPDSEEAVLENISFSVKQAVKRLQWLVNYRKIHDCKINPTILWCFKRKITIGGVDIRNLKQSELHDLIGYVPQSQPIFGKHSRKY